MKKEACHLLLALVLAVAGVTGIWAEDEPSDDLTKMCIKM